MGEGEAAAEEGCLAPVGSSEAIHEPPLRQRRDPMPDVYVYECAARDARFSMIEPDPPSQTESCIYCFAKGARLVCKAGEQQGDLHRFPSQTKLLDGTTSKRNRRTVPRRLK